MLSKMSFCLTTVAAVLGILDLLFTDEQKARLNVRLEALSNRLRGFGMKGFFHFIFTWKAQAILVVMSLVVASLYIIKTPSPMDVLSPYSTGSIRRWIVALPLALIPTAAVVLILIPMIHLVRFFLSRKSGVMLLAGCLLPFAVLAAILMLVESTAAFLPVKPLVERWTVMVLSFAAQILIAMVFFGGMFALNALLCLMWFAVLVLLPPASRSLGYMLSRLAAYPKGSLLGFSLLLLAVNQILKNFYG